MSPIRNMLLFIVLVGCLCGVHQALAFAPSMTGDDNVDIIGGPDPDVMSQEEIDDAIEEIREQLEDLYEQLKGALEAWAIGFSYDATHFGTPTMQPGDPVMKQALLTPKTDAYIRVGSAVRVTVWRPFTCSNLTRVVPAAYAIEKISERYYGSTKWNKCRYKIYYYDVAPRINTTIAIYNYYNPYDPYVSGE